MAMNDNGIWRPNQEWRSLITGRGQSSSVGHKSTMLREAIKMAKSGEYVHIYLDRAINTVFGTHAPHLVSNEFPFRNRPDLVAVDKQGRFHLVEVASNGDYRANGRRLITRSEINWNALPKNFQGSLSYINPRDGVNPNHKWPSIGEVGHETRLYFSETPKTFLQTAGRTALKSIAVLSAGAAIYSIYAAEDRWRASIVVLGELVGGTIGGALGCLTGTPIGILGGSVVGSSLGGRLANYVYDKALGGIDLSASLTFDDYLPHISSIAFDPTTNSVCALTTSDEHLQLKDVSLSDFGVALNLAYFNHEAPAFSLDPFDPQNPYGEFQKKVFYPSWLAGTDFGEVMFAADYLLKELMLGVQTREDGILIPTVCRVPHFKTIFDYGASGCNMTRLWIYIHKLVIRKKTSKDGCVGLSVDEVILAVNSRDQVIDPSSTTGLRDAEPMNYDNSGHLFAQQCTTRMKELIAAYPALKRLVTLIKAHAIARLLVEHKVPIDPNWVALMSVPECFTDMKVPTLKRSISTSTRTTTTQTTTSTIQVIGGCVIDGREGYRVIIEERDDHLKDLIAAAAIPLRYSTGRSLIERQDDSNVVPNSLPVPFVVSGAMISQCCSCFRKLNENETAFLAAHGGLCCSRLKCSNSSDNYERITPYTKCALCQNDIKTGAIITRRDSESPAKDYHRQCFVETYPHEEVNDIQEQPPRHSSAELPIITQKPRVSQKSENLTPKEIQTMREKRLERFNNMPTVNQMKTESNTASSTQPKTSVAAPVIVQDPLISKLSDLKLIGFNDENMDRKFLTENNGNVSDTVEALLTNATTVDPFAEQLQTLKMMGFTDEAVNRMLLRDCDNDCDRVIELLLGQYH